MLVIKGIVAKTETIFKLVKYIGRKIDTRVRKVAYIPKAGKWFGYDLSKFLELPLINVESTDLTNNSENLLLVDCICDSGETLQKWIRKLRPLQTAVFISRVRKDKILDADIVGIVYPKDYFLVGYGLDYNDKYRSFKCIFETELADNESYRTRDKEV